MFLRSICLVLVTLVSGALPETASAKNVYVRGYFTDNGAYVAPHYRPSLDSNTFNYWSIPGYVNPYTGKLNHYYKGYGTTLSPPIVRPAPCYPGVSPFGCAKLPSNAHLDESGMGWVCNSGYKQIRATCIEIAVPLHATLSPSGAEWSCDLGFKQHADQCLRANTCQAGFFASQKDCLPLPRYARAKPTGGWECFDGFAEKRNGCEVKPRRLSRTQTASGIAEQGGLY